MAETELKPCPFCAGKPNPRLPEGWRSLPKLEELTEEAGGGWRVICYGCGVSTRDGWFKTPEGAAAAWNLRNLAAAEVDAARRDEREACLRAVLNERLPDQPHKDEGDQIYYRAIADAAEAIRARGGTDDG